MTRGTLFLTLVLSASQLTLTAGRASSGETGLDPASNESLHAAHSLSCPELDDRLTRLEPLTYSDSPGFYSDPLVGIAVWAGTLWSPAWAYVGYYGLREQYQQSRITDIDTEIQQLRQLKAERHCYER